MARLFISYRTADGRDKATALARDLGERFGDEQVFLDKDDLRAGVRWRDEIARTLRQQPVLLLLLTPQLLAATDETGALRIVDPDDPVRREVVAALAAGAHLIPLLCDDLPGPPDAATLPPPFDRLGEFTWRPLRAYDWKNDLQRLVDDLDALGLAPAATSSLAEDDATTAPADQPKPKQRLTPALAAALTASLILTLAGGWYALRRPAPPALPGGLPTTTPPTVDGGWLAALAPDEQLTLALRQSGTELTLLSRPVNISQRADWADYRRFWREHSATDLLAIAYRGKGSSHLAADGSTVVDIALEVISSPGEAVVDTGNLHVTLASDGRSMIGSLWLNSEQKERAAHLTRIRQEQ